MVHVSYLGEQLRRHCREAANQRAVHAADRWWTYGELIDRADRLRGELALVPGDVVAVLADRGIEPVLAICAAALGDAVPATIDPGDGALASRSLARLQPAVAVAVHALDPSYDVLERTGATVRLTRRTEPPPWQPVRRPGIAHIVFTSGTTSEAKGVVWSEARAGFDWAMREPPPLHRAGPGAIAAPLSTAYGLQDLLRSLYDGVATVLLEPPFLAGVAQVRELEVNRIKLTPTHVSLLLASAEQLPAVRAVVIGAAPIAPAQIEALSLRLPAARIGRSYGMTEAGPGTAVWRDRNPGRMHTVGRPIAMRAVSIRDRVGNVLPPGTWGEVVIELPVWDRRDGYLDAPPELDRRFRNARLWTGDRGLLDARGFLVLGPRLAEIIKIGGRSASAPRIEEALAGRGGVRELAVVGVADRLRGETPCAIFVPAPGCDPPALAAGAAGRDDEAPQWFLPRPDLPRAANGKLRRGALAREAAAWTQTFPDAAAWGHRLYPAFFIEDSVAVVDGGLDPGLADCGAAPGRVVLLIESAAARLLAVGCVRATASGARTVRLVLGPRAVTGRVAHGLFDVFAGELIRLARLLPGDPAVIEYALADRVVAFEAAGFAAVPGHAGWLRRAAAPGSSDGGEPVDLVREAATFGAWAARVQRESQGGSR